MLKTLTLAGVVLAASTGIAFADTSDSMTTTDTTTTTSTDASSTDAAPAPKAMKHRHHKKHKKHHHRHYYKTAEAAPVAEAAPTGGYKGEMPCPTCPRPVFNTGAYVGIGAGSVVNYLSNPAVSTEIQGTLFGGYSMMWDQLYGALEIFVQDAAVINTYRYSVLGGGRARNGSANSSWGYGISVLPGYMINDQVLGFLRLGVLNTRFTTSNGNNETGGQIGLGMQTSLTPCWDLRGEWDYNFYNSMNIGSPKSQQFNLGLLYKFQV